MTRAFERIDGPAHAEPPPERVDEHVGDELARAVERREPAALRLVHLDAVRGEDLARWQVAHLAPPGRQHRRMLEEPDRLRLGPRDHLLAVRALALERLAVRNRSEPLPPDHSRGCIAQAAGVSPKTRLAR
jgi:hypothetical protein